MNKLTPRAQQILAWAGTEAESLKHPSISPELIVLSMLNLGQGVAFTVLTKAGVTKQKIAEYLSNASPAPDAAAVDHASPRASGLPYSQRAKDAMEFADWEAEALNHQYLGTEHLLLGILREEETSGTSGILRSLGIDAETLLHDIFHEIDPTYTGGDLKASKVLDSTRIAPCAMKAIALAQKEALRYAHRNVGTDHLLLAITKMEEGVATRVLGKLGVKIQKLRDEIAKHGCIDGQSAPHSPEVVTYTARFSKVLKYAEQESKAMGHACLGSEHLLLGLLRDSDNFVAKTLNNLGAQLAAARTEVLKEHDPATGESDACEVIAPAHAPVLVLCSVKLPQEILDSANKLGMVLDDYIEHVHNLAYPKEDLQAH